MRPRTQAWSVLAPWALAIVGLAAAAGCAGEDKQLDSMRAELDKIESSRDAEDRKAMTPADEDIVTSSPSRAVVAPPAPPPPVAPAVREVTLGAFDEPPDDYADTDDASPRPSIRVIGSPRPGRSGGWRGDDQVQQTGTDDAAGTGARTGAPQALDPAAKRAYDAALSLIAARQYPQALDALAAFLVKWPDHPYADNAMYWRGEAYFARGEFAQAADQFEGVLARFPGGNKVPDALLKLGLCAQRMGDPARAKGYFDRLAQQYPQSEAARRIPSAGPTPQQQPGPVPEDHP